MFCGAVCEPSCDVWLNGRDSAAEKTMREKGKYEEGFKYYLKDTQREYLSAMRTYVLKEKMPDGQVGCPIADWAGNITVWPLGVVLGKGHSLVQKAENELRSLEKDACLSRLRLCRVWFPYLRPCLCRCLGRHGGVVEAHCA